MELVPIIWTTLLLGSIVLLVVLLISFVACKLKKNDSKISNEFNLIPDRPVVITRRHQNPNIKVTTSKYEKVRVKKEHPPRIFDINKTKNKISKRPIYTEVYKPNTFTHSHFDGSHYGGSKKRNPRFTVLNETMSTSADIQKHLNVSNSNRFTETNFI